MFFGVIGSTAEMLKGFTLMPSVTDIIFLHIMTTVKGPSRRPDVSLNTLTRSPGRMRYFLSTGSLTGVLL